MVPIKAIPYKYNTLSVSANLSEPSSEEIGWHLERINISGAWDISQGSEDIVVAVIDSGIDFNHTDLSNSTWINNDEIPDNDVDDDNNGYIDDIVGWDFVNNDTVPGPEEEDPIHWHATFIAGIISGAYDGSGIVGVAPNVKVMDLRVLNATNYQGTTLAELGAAIKYAVDNGADVISMSLQYYQTSDSYRDDIIYAISHNIPVVSITGNTLSNYGGGQEYESYPGAYPEVIAVGATNYYDQKADYSNYGDYLELVAPVGDENFDSLDHLIKSTYFEGEFIYGYGTSFAAPQVAAVIALMKSTNNSLTVGDIRTILTTTATDLGDPGKDKYFGYGLINATAALREVINHIPPTNTSQPTTPPTTSSPLTNSSIPDTSETIIGSTVLFVIIDLFVITTIIIQIKQRKNK